MAFRMNEKTTKIQFATSREMPSMIYRACLRTEVVSQTAYCQRAVAEALARDLNIPLTDILAHLPPNRGPSAHLFDPMEGKLNRYPVRIGAGNTNEQVR